jgi:predicted dienelactone hydrolase
VALRRPNGPIARRAPPPLVAWLGLIALLALPAPGADAAGAAVGVQTESLRLADQASAVDLYAPESAPRAVAVVAHGFTRSRVQHGVLARRLAEAGFFVAVPDLPHWSRHEANADAIVELVGQVEAMPGLGALPVVLIGTSAGGLASLLAAPRVPRLVLWIGLDPVDAFGQAKTAARALRVPALVLRAPAGACNVGGSARRIAGWLPAGRIDRRIDGASHCDFEDTTDANCESICGAADPARQARIVALAVAAAREAVGE